MPVSMVNFTQDYSFESPSMPRSSSPPNNQSFEPIREDLNTETRTHKRDDGVTIESTIDQSLSNTCKNELQLGTAGSIGPNDGSDEIGLEDQEMLERLAVKRSADNDIIETNFLQRPTNVEHPASMFTFKPPNSLQKPQLSSTEDNPEKQNQGSPGASSALHNSSHETFEASDDGMIFAPTSRSFH